MRTLEKRTKHATYMREYYKNPEHKLKKKISDAKNYKIHHEKRLEQMRKYYSNLSLDKKKQLTLKNKLWKQTHPQYKQYEKEYKKQYYAKETQEERKMRIQKDVERNKIYWKRNPQHIRDYNNKRSRNQKLQILYHYSYGTMRCMNPDCEVPGGAKNINALTIDHINGGGNKHRKEKHINSLSKWLIQQYPFPEGYQVLCMSCQFIKAAKNKENCGCPRKF